MATDENPPVTLIGSEGETGIFSASKAENFSDAPISKLDLWVDTGERIHKDVI